MAKKTNKTKNKTTAQTRQNSGSKMYFRYLSTKVEVAQENCCLGAGDEQNDENQEEESKHIVHLMRPKAQTPPY